ncbi:MAG: DPP IV N-terminal domain-containing protein [candidate division KSB1 bacterium]|nr:DPP IV N-terminal domain-containing protein [candidate division KSB1 bacterium]MDZ7272480.1 DPP IV N-terminal domain-containing protein [candidate division KSB1 bacterium]MDZ7284496.1 DPP IV N-terminal domain-containing protein [candidate division KSB1 bacterium]MDZ7297108.1 DPP IV N-terminal domain-containing protein [candidate division KSB1 bacterium]MDZ7306556.1 DPP IV N-terminal domain-containing protein [candidate division KSB1 bacterium]
MMLKQTVAVCGRAACDKGDAPGWRRGAAALNRVPRHPARIVLAALAVCASLAAAQDEPRWTHPELKWQTIETEHFFVHFHEGAEQTGRLTAKIAEEIYTPITSLYGYQPDGKVHFIIRDYDDFSNGAAYYLDNKVEIWASAMDFELRGTHSWLRNVITHEYTHMISLGAARKITRHLPAAYVQWLGYEDEKRPDVLYGYPNRILSYPLPFTIMPPWFAEGVAQYQRPELEYDLWDSHRDMLLRTAVVEDKLLTYSEMNVFGKNSIGSERVYNQGYSLVTYLAGKHGAAVLQQIAANMRSPLRFSFDSAIKKATGKSGGQIYDEWKKHLQQTYAQQLRAIQGQVVAGELLQAKGSGNFYPRWSPDGSRLAYLSNAGADYLGQTALVMRQGADGRDELIRSGVHHAFSWSPDGTQLAYSRKSEKNPHHAVVYDLYLYDIKKKKEKRLTHAARAHSPSWSPDGKMLACVVNGDGSQNIALYDLAADRLKIITSHQTQEQVYTPQWSPDGRQLVYAYSHARGRSLRLCDLASGEVTPVNLRYALMAESSDARPGDARDAVFSPDGRKIYFSWDVTGIFNIYSLDLATQQVTPLTNVVGGAFMPSVNREGGLLFSIFVAEGYKIAHLKTPQPLPPDVTRYLPPAERQLQLAAVTGDLAHLNLSGIKHGAYDDRQIPDFAVTPYRGHYSAVAILPRVMVDYGKLKLGSYFYSSEILDNISFIGGAALNRDKDYDLFLLVDYDKLGPQLSLEAYNQARHARAEGYGFLYNLTEVNLGTQRWWSSRHHSQFRLIYSRYNAKISFVERGFKQSFGYTYYEGKALAFRHHFRQQVRAVDGDINPRMGREVEFRYTREFNNFINSDPDKAFTLTDYGTFVENYEPHNVHRVELAWTERLPLPGRTGLTLSGRGGWLDREVNSFFYFFAGGLDGVRGYPYYSMEGRYLLHGRLTYRLPLFRHLDLSLLHLYLDKICFAVSYDYGGAFSQTRGWRDKLHDSINLQLRSELFSFYGFPTRLSCDAAYGFDKFVLRREGQAPLTYGREWRYYLTVAFDFLDN